MNIEILRYVNFSVNLVGILVISVIIICLATGENRMNRSNKLFINALLSCICYMSGEAIAWLIKGNSDMIWGIQLANDIVFLSGYIILITFTDYLLDYLSEKSTVPNGINWVMYTLGAAGLLLVIINRFTGMLYAINQDGYYQRGKYMILTQILVMSGIFVDTWLVFRFRRCLGRHRSIIMTAYTIIPLTAMSLQIVVYGVPFLSTGFLLFSVLLFTGIQSQQAKIIKEQELENQEQRIAVMLSQIQPHFIFNVLLSVKYLCKTDPDAAGDVIDNFARYLRRNLEALESKKPVPFEEELGHVKTYLYLEKRRYKDLLKLEFDIQATAFCLPALTVQPIVENAVRHGVSKKEEGGTVRVSTGETQEGYIITIEDDGVGFDTDIQPEEGREHVGIKNVSQRLAMQCGGTISWNSEKGKGTVVTIKLKKL